MNLSLPAVSTRIVFARGRHPANYRVEKAEVKVGIEAEGDGFAIVATRAAQDADVPLRMTLSPVCEKMSDAQFYWNFGVVTRREAGSEKDRLIERLLHLGLAEAL